MFGYILAIVLRPGARIEIRVITGVELWIKAWEVRAQDLLLLVRAFSKNF